MRMVECSVGDLCSCLCAAVQNSLQEYLVHIYNVKSDQQVREYTRKLPENLLWGQILFTVLLIVTLTKMSVTFCSIVLMLVLVF